MRKFIIVVLIVALGIPGLTLLMNRTKQEPVTEEAFRELTRFSVDGNAEILQVSPDGNLLLLTNSTKQRVDILDISAAAQPLALASVAVPGEPTSVGISPDGQWAMATLYLSNKKSADPRLPGGLALIDLRVPSEAQLVALIGIGHHPDSLVMTRLGRDLIAIVAVENEPVVRGGDDSVPTDVADDEPGNPNDISLPGAVQIVTINPYEPGTYRVAALDLSVERMTAAGLLFPDDPQPEFITLSPDRNVAAASLQENNGIVIFDPYSGEINQLFSLGEVADRPADLISDGEARLEQRYPADASAQKYAGTRFPDAIAFSPNGSLLISADEGEMALTGGRGISLWDTNGTFVWDDGGEIERLAVARGLYPDSRSEAKGIEIESVATATLNSVDYAFALSERGGFMAIYDLSVPETPVFVSMHATGTAPESVAVVPTRGLIIVGDETGGTLTLFEHAAPSP